MTMNVMNVWGEIIGIAAGAVILLIFGLTFSPLVYRPRTPSGAAVRRPSTTAQDQQHQARGNETGGEHVSADGYIDSFAGLVEEAGGSLPLVVSVFTIGLFIWWGAYLVVNWSQYLFSVRSFWR